MLLLDRAVDGTRFCSDGRFIMLYGFYGRSDTRPNYFYSVFFEAVKKGLGVLKNRSFKKWEILKLVLLFRSTGPKKL
ncbi:protein of unknown function [Ruminococcaceae bacterium BL-4]|nr:protein of unknown function [Ruminococcaceae bacterium BL-4]